MAQPVTIENDHLRLEVWPQFGGKVSSIVDKVDNFELLFTYPAELPTRCQYGMRYDDAWYAGWDECFPAVAPGAYPLHPYEGIQVPDHGELWPLPTTAVPTRDGITTVWHGLRFGYRLTRKLFLATRSIVAEYTLVNLAPFEFRFCWAQHALFSVASPVELDFGAALRLAGGSTWPTLDEQNAFDRYDTLPAGLGWKVFSDAPITHPAIVRYPERKRSLMISYAPESGPSAYWGIWINTGGWGGQRHLAVEPTTARSDFIHTGVEDGSAARLEPMGRAQWRTTFTVAGE